MIQTVHITLMHKAPANYSWMMRRRNDMARIIFRSIKMALIYSDKTTPSYLDVTFKPRGLLDDTVAHVDVSQFNEAEVQLFVKYLKTNPKIGLIQLISAPEPATMPT